MSANPDFSNSQPLEHRWGTRVALDIPADLRTPEGIAIPAWVRNASLSGAFVETGIGFPVLSQLSLRPLVGGGEWLDALVVRVASDGLGIEWLEPGLHAVASLLALRRNEPVAHALRHGNVHPLKLIPQRRAP
ncbi:MAG TPA: hypothetical protein VN762_11230 [Steroidobacteraceae bacterium]|nr:hypothetical protein [Steroidobacteraceae bacterium]